MSTYQTKTKILGSVESQTWWRKTNHDIPTQLVLTAPNHAWAVVLGWDWSNDGRARQPAHEINASLEAFLRTCETGTPVRTGQTSLGQLLVWALRHGQGKNNGYDAQPVFGGTIDRNRLRAILPAFVQHPSVSMEDKVSVWTMPLGDCAEGAVCFKVRDTFAVLACVAFDPSDESGRDRLSCAPLQAR